MTHMNSIELLNQVQKELAFIQKKYTLIGLAGEGTFSRVYKAVHNESKRLVAIKAVTKTSSPSRVYEELKILKELKGCTNVIQLLDVMREKDQIIMVFPYFESIDFKNMITQIGCNIDIILKYIKNILISVSEIHKKGIIHRDIKPGNFLYNVEQDMGYLIDFGLAQYDKPRKESSPEKAKKPLIFFNSIVTQSKPPGYYERDSRQPMKAPRGGTRGFRAPEVLFKSLNQTKALDIWSVGVILLCHLTQQYPFFLSIDDIDGLVELGIMFGHAEMRRIARHYGRTWKSNISTITEEGLGFENAIQILNPNYWCVHEAVLDLLKRLLDPICDTRITAEDALKHPAFQHI